MIIRKKKMYENENEMLIQARYDMKNEFSSLKFMRITIISRILLGYINR